MSPRTQTPKSKAATSKATKAAKEKAPKLPKATKDDAESFYIGAALQRLEAESDLERKELVKVLGVSYSHFSNLVTDVRPAGLPSIRRMAKRTGRAMAFFFGDLEALATIGVLTLSGAVMMNAEPHLPALVRVEEAVGPFRPGDLLHIRPTTWEPDQWVLMREGDVYFIAASAEHAGLRVYRTLTGKSGLIDEQATATVVGVIQQITTSPPPPPSVVLRSAENRH